MRKTFFLALFVCIIINCYGQDYKVKYQDFKYGYVDGSGQWIIEPKFDYANDFENDLGLVRLNDKYGLIDRGGNYITPCKWDYIELFNFKKDGYIRVDLGDKCGIIDGTGREILSCIYDKFPSKNPWGYFEAKINEKKGLCDKDGKIIVPFYYDDVYFFPDERGFVDIAINKKKGLYGNGVEVIPCKYSDIYFNTDYNAYLVSINENGKNLKGMYDKNGKLVFPCIYESIYHYDNCFKLILNGTELTADLNGNIISYPDKQITPVQKRLKISGNWSYSIDYSQQTVYIKGDKIENLLTSEKSDMINISLCLTKSKYSGGTIDGYILASFNLDQLPGGYYYKDIEKLLNYNVTPPSKNYYVTLLLSEKSEDGFVIIDYLNFDELIAFDSRKTERIINAIAIGLSTLNNSLNIYNNSINNTYTNPANINNNNGNNGHMENISCTYCHGTGQNPAKEHGAQYGLGTSYTNSKCEICGSYEVHYHKSCPSCGGKGYTKKWIH